MGVTFAIALASLTWLAQSAAVSTVNQPRQRGGLYRRQQHEHANVQQKDWWNYANTTTDGATRDGLVGIILEPDIIVGAPGIDGGVQRVGRYLKVFELH
jgi:hypothetical protein